MPSSIAASNISIARKKSIVKNTVGEDVAKCYLAKGGINCLNRLVDLVNQANAMLLFF